jgi:hypothetical protein
MRDIPITVLLSFPVPNYTNPDTRGPALLIVNGVFIAIVIAVVLLRLYTRIFIKRWVGSDDIFIVIATVGHHSDAVSKLLFPASLIWSMDSILYQSSADIYMFRFLQLA